MHNYKLTILEHHLDSFGHVNNATYLEIFEEARWDLITSNGFGFNEIQKTQIGPVILEVNLKFLRELKNRDSIQVTTELVGHTATVGKLQQKILFSDGRLAAEALFSFALFDLKNRKIIAPTAEWKKAIGLT